MRQRSIACSLSPGVTAERDDENAETKARLAEQAIRVANNLRKGFTDDCARKKKVRAAATPQQWPMPERLRSGLGLRRLVDVVNDVGRISTHPFVILGSIRKPSTIIDLEPDVKTKQIPRLRPTSPACCTRTTRLRTFSSSTSRACGCRTSGQMPYFGLQSGPFPQAPRTGPGRNPPAAASRAWPCVLDRAR